LYSLCNWGEDYPFNWAPTIANSWRITGDIYDEWDKYDARCPWYVLKRKVETNKILLTFTSEGPDAWDCRLPGFHCSVTNIMNKASFITSKSIPGAWNDLDMLEVGNGAMTDDEYVAHFSLCMFFSPSPFALKIIKYLIKLRGRCKESLDSRKRSPGGPCC